MKKVFSIINRQENTTEELIYVVEQYIKERKGVDININLDKHNPKVPMNVFWQDNYISQIGLLDSAFRTAATWFFEHEHKYNK